MNKTNLEIGKAINVAGIKTNYHDEGSGPPVLLIHGSGPGVSAWVNWRLTIPALSKNFRVLAPDVVGFGYTERPQDFAYSMDAWVSHIIGFLDALSIDNVSVVGNSFGGGLALALAIRFKNRLDKLILLGSVGVGFKLTEGLDKTWGYTPSLENMKALLDIFAFDRSLVTDEMANLRYVASMRPGVQASFEKMFPAPRQQGIDAMISDTKDIRAIDKKTLILHGREDRVIPKENAYTLFSLIHDSQLHLFGRCGHWVQIEHADRFNRLVNDFLSENS